MSIFHAERFERPFPLPLIAFEHLASLAHLEPVDACLRTMIDCCGVPDPNESQIKYFLDRVQGDAEKANALVESRPAPNPDQRITERRSLGSSFDTFIRSLDSSRLLMLACHGDYEKAKHLYTKVDRDDAMQVINDFIRLHTERNTILFESVLYGFGGSYKGDALGDDRGDGNDVGIDELRSLFAS